MKNTPSTKQNTLKKNVVQVAFLEGATIAHSNDFSAIYDLYNDAIFRFCLRQSRDYALGQDLMQETFLRFWICVERKDEILHVRAFLYRIARNLFIDHVRKKKEASLEQLVENGFEPAIDPWRTTLVHMEADRILKKLGTMRQPYQQVLQYRFNRGLLPSHIARITGETPNTVSVRIHRGLQQLRYLVKNGATV